MPRPRPRPGVCPDASALSSLQSRKTSSRHRPLWSARLRRLRASPTSALSTPRGRPSALLQALATIDTAAIGRVALPGGVRALSTQLQRTLSRERFGVGTGSTFEPRLNCGCLQLQKPGGPPLYRVLRSCGLPFVPPSLYRSYRSYRLVRYRPTGSTTTTVVYPDPTNKAPASPVARATRTRPVLRIPFSRAIPSLRSSPTYVAP